MTFCQSKSGLAYGERLQFVNNCRALHLNNCNLSSQHVAAWPMPYSCPSRADVRGHLSQENCLQPQFLPSAARARCLKRPVLAPMSCPRTHSWEHNALAQRAKTGSRAPEPQAAVEAFEKKAVSDPKGLAKVPLMRKPGQSQSQSPRWQPPYKSARRQDQEMHGAPSIKYSQLYLRGTSYVAVRQNGGMSRFPAPPTLPVTYYVCRAPCVAHVCRGKGVAEGGCHKKVPRGLLHFGRPYKPLGPGLWTPIMDNRWTLTHSKRPNF